MERIRDCKEQDLVELHVTQEEAGLSGDERHWGGSRTWWSCTTPEITNKMMSKYLLYRSIYRSLSLLHAITL